MTNLVADAAVASKLTGDSRIGAFRLGVALFTAVEAGTGSGSLGAFSLGMSNGFISQ